MSDNQGLRQLSVEAVTGTALDYNGDFSALFDQAGIAVGDFNGRFLAWINANLGASYTDLNSAKAALAIANSAPDWDGLGTFSATTGNPSDLTTEAGVDLETEAGSLLTTEH
jgi:regulation of enolase protein 1 (concanavalin A-like superfamily)